MISPICSSLHNNQQKGLLVCKGSQRLQMGLKPNYYPIPNSHPLNIRTNREPRAKLQQMALSHLLYQTIFASLKALHKSIEQLSICLLVGALWCPPERGSPFLWKKRVEKASATILVPRVNGHSLPWEIVFPVPFILWISLTLPFPSYHSMLKWQHRINNREGERKDPRNLTSALRHKSQHFRLVTHHSTPQKHFTSLPFSQQRH